jgi:hypothetical protein
VPLEVLHRPLVFPGRGERREGAEISPLSGLWILLSRIQPVSAGPELSDHLAVSSQGSCVSTRHEMHDQDHDANQEQDP